MKRVALTALGSQTPKTKEGPQAPKNEKEVRSSDRSVGAAQPPHARGIVTEWPRPAGAWGVQRLEPNPAQPDAPQA